jgi:hypothetical protein
MDGLVELLLYVVLSILGWPIRVFRRWLDRQPHRGPSQISTMHKAGRLAVGFMVSLAVLLPLGWFIFK